MSLIKMQFDPEVAKDVGTDAAIILSNIEYWQAKNEANKTHYHEGKYWTYNSVEAFAKLFNYLTPSKIRTCLKNLEESGYVVSGNHNKSSYDRTKWYSSIRQIHLRELTNGFDETHEPIPDNKPNSKPNKKETRAHEFLKLKVPSRFETLEMQNKKHIAKWDDLLEGFSDKVIIEKLEWDADILFARLNSYVRAWRSNEVDRVGGEPVKPVYLRKIS